MYAATKGLLTNSVPPALRKKSSPRCAAPETYTYFPHPQYLPHFSPEAFKHENPPPPIPPLGLAVDQSAFGHNQESRCSTPREKKKHHQQYGEVNPPPPFRLERDAWSTVESLRQGKHKMSTPPPPTASNNLHDQHFDKQTHPTERDFSGNNLWRPYPSASTHRATNMAKVSRPSSSPPRLPPTTFMISISTSKPTRWNKKCRGKIRAPISFGIHAPQVSRTSPRSNKASTLTLALLLQKYSHTFQALSSFRKKKNLYKNRKNYRAQVPHADCLEKKKLHANRKSYKTQITHYEQYFV